MLNKGENSRRPISDYVGNEHLVSYIRVTKRYINGDFHSTLEIANVTVDEDTQHQGVFKNFLKLIEDLADEYGRTVYIESVLNDILIDKLPMYGYVQAKNSIPPSYYKMFKD